MMVAHTMLALLIGPAVVQESDHNGDVKEAEVYEVRQMLGGEEFKAEWRALVAIGERVFPIYLQILTAKDVNPTEVGRIFSVLAAVKADRSRFLDHAIAALTHADNSVRWSALYLLAEIGSARDSAPIVALLSDHKLEVSFAAAKTLAKIGDQRTLIAMSVWLNSVTPKNSGNDRDNEVLRQHVIRHRDELKQRLEKEKK